MTLRHGVRRSSRVPTYTPTTPGMASSSLSCAASTALISRFGEDELPWAIFCRQPKKRASETNTKQAPNRRQKIRQDCILGRLHCKKCAHACRRMFRDLSFARGFTFHHGGTRDSRTGNYCCQQRVNPPREDCPHVLAFASSLRTEFTQNYMLESAAALRRQPKKRPPRWNCVSPDFASQLSPYCFRAVSCRQKPESPRLKGCPARQMSKPLLACKSFFTARILARQADGRYNDLARKALALYPNPAENNHKPHRHITRR